MYVEKGIIGESGRLIADIIESTGVLNKEGFLVTMDIEKAFDSLDHTFVIRSNLNLETRISCNRWR